jgi:methyltransferase (TIGR00027 family)
MKESQPSRTALAAAVHRAAHQTLEGGRIFSDPFASKILGSEGAKLLAEEAADPSQRPMRLFIAARSRFAEDRLAAAVSRGVRQAVILGAGLDTFALRNPHAELGLHIFEVDHPSTQQWKKRQLSEAGIDTPPWLTLTPVDFERQDLLTELARSGFAPSKPAFFHWLGVISSPISSGKRSSQRYSTLQVCRNRKSCSIIRSHWKTMRRSAVPAWPLSPLEQLQLANPG